MDRRGQHLNCAERAVIFSEDRRGSSQRQIAGLPGRAASTICRELARGRPPEGTDRTYCARAVVSASMTSAGRAAAPGASSSRVGRAISSCVATCWICAGLPRRSPRDCGACILMILRPVCATRRSMR